MPHGFSWLIWGISTLVVFLSQLSSGGSEGSLLILQFSLFCFCIAFFSLKNYRSQVIRQSDWLILFISLLGLALWVFINTPLYAMLLSTGIIVGAYIPTAMKCYHTPHLESWGLFTLFNIPLILNILALESLNLTTLFYPVTISITNCIIVGIILWRRNSTITKNTSSA